MLPDFAVGLHGINKIQKPYSGRKRQTMSKIKVNHKLLWKVISSIKNIKEERKRYKEIQREFPF